MRNNAHDFGHLGHDLNIHYINCDALKPYKNNARTHSKHQIKQIANSIREFGFTNPILIDDDKNIIAGHGRIVAQRRPARRGSREAGRAPVS